jgi:hypothetical protein
MFWIVLLFVAGLAGLAYGWIVVRSSSERITISLELEKIAPVLRKAKGGALGVVHSFKSVHERHGQQSRTGHPS